MVRPMATQSTGCQANNLLNLDENNNVIKTLNDIPMQLSGLENLGKHLVKRTPVGNEDYNPSELTEDYIVAFTDTSSPRNCIISTEDVQSGTPTKPRIIIIKDESGNAGTNNITITLENGGNIDGSASFVINANYNSITLYLDGTNAWIF